jgi:hypothetical protein
VVQFARRLAGLLVAGALAVGLPMAAVRAGCLCDHGHAHGGASALAAEPHTCTAACTAATCPMHRRGAVHASHAGSTAPRAGIRCSCSGDAQALIGHATTVAILPPVALLAVPSSAPLAGAAAPAPAPSLQPSPPAPPPRA